MHFYTQVGIEFCTVCFFPDLSRSHMVSSIEPPFSEISVWSRTAEVSRPGTQHLGTRMPVNEELSCAERAIGFLLALQMCQFWLPCMQADMKFYSTNLYSLYAHFWHSQLCYSIPHSAFASSTVVMLSVQMELPSFASNGVVFYQDSHYNPYSLSDCKVLTFDFQLRRYLIIKVNTHDEKLLPDDVFYRPVGNPCINVNIVFIRWYQWLLHDPWPPMRSCPAHLHLSSSDNRTSSLQMSQPSKMFWVNLYHKSTGLHVYIFPPHQICLASADLQIYYQKLVPHETVNILHMSFEDEMSSNIENFTSACHCMHSNVGSMCWLVYGTEKC